MVMNLMLLLILLQSCTWCLSAAQVQFDSSSVDNSSPVVSVTLFVSGAAFFLSGLLFVAFRKHLAACLGIYIHRGGAGGGVGNRAPQGLSREVIDAFPTYLYDQVIKLHGLVDSEQECAICLSEFEHHEALRLLPQCSHIFHSQCIDPWLLSQATCPKCRATIQETSGNTSDASEDDHNHVIIIDPFLSVKSPIHQDLDHCSPSQPEHSPTTTEGTGTIQVAPARLTKSQSTGYAIALLNGCQPSSPVYSRDRAFLYEEARIPWRRSMELIN